MDQQPQPQQPQPPVQAPVETPVQPQSQPVEQVPSLTPPEPKKSKKAAVIAGIVSLVFLMLVAFLVWFFAFRVTISAEDYKQASTDSVALQTSYQKLYDMANEKLPGMIIGYREKTDAADVKELKTLFQDYNQKSETFLKLNALKDKDIKEGQKQFFEKNEQFIVFMNGFFESVTPLKNMEVCAKAKMTNYTHKTALIVYDKAYGPCFDVIDDLIASKNVVVSKYGIALRKNFDDLRDLHEDIQNAALAGNEAARQKASNKILALDPETHMQTADLAVLDGVDAVDVSNQLKSLQGVLKSKAQ